VVDVKDDLEIEIMQRLDLFGRMIASTLVMSSSLP